MIDTKKPESLVEGNEKIIAAKESEEESATRSLTYYLNKLKIKKRSVSAIKDVRKEEEFLMIKFSYDNELNQDDSNIF